VFCGHTIFEVLDWKMEMHCPHCQSTDLRKVSLVYQEGRLDAKARTRLRGFLLGTDGPDLVVGGANSTGVLQSQLSRNLRPPVKWSFLKLAGWFALSSFVALIAYVHSVMSTSATASSLPVSIYVVVASCLLLFLGFCSGDTTISSIRGNSLLGNDRSCARGVAA
jgi:hypothetical protein